MTQVLCFKGTLSVASLFHDHPDLPDEIDDVEKLMEKIKQAARENAMLIYTLADENMDASVRHAFKRWGVPSTDILNPIIEEISLHLGVSPSGLPCGLPSRKFPLTEDYFKRIYSIDITIKQDDGDYQIWIM
ncbi:pyruvate, phosphate dikinase regulatory protein, chloroplastic [Artemisia annua]|uniref:Pyruvate, phosphate dikinase regulatory protein, chloroplastic n=1 Tax=Artemisia annua TaxID=35608 RepID=A0A2U1L7W1_ARTAN|nr:pyruvate, phosphate dikinase regulatory protein, chloroplastic [Artemisia annua]